MKKIALIFGTRPEAIKLASVIKELNKYPKIFDVKVCVTAQHRQMLDQVLRTFEIIPDYDLNLMGQNQSLAQLTSAAIFSIDEYLKKTKPDIVIIQGDTTTVFCTAIAAFYNNIKIAHVEAGLRTGNLRFPWPEEMNRVITTKLAEYHFAPTEESKKNLIKEGVDKRKIFLTGNTVIDTLKLAIRISSVNPPNIPGLADKRFDYLSKKFVLITFHRRESYGEAFETVCYAISKLADLFPNIYFVYPVHLNPNVQGPVNSILGRNNGNIILLEPLSYLHFVTLMQKCEFILTDSGGIQEEAPSLGKPVLLLRNHTERPEGVNSGTVKIIGTKTSDIIKEVTKLLSDQDYYTQMSVKSTFYGDGSAAIRIVEILRRELA